MDGQRKSRFHVQNSSFISSLQLHQTISPQRANRSKLYILFEDTSAAEEIWIYKCTSIKSDVLFSAQILRVVSKNIVIKTIVRNKVLQECFIGVNCPRGDEVGIFFLKEPDCAHICIVTYVHHVMQTARINGKICET